MITAALIHANMIKVVWVLVTCIGASLKFMILMDARFDYRQTLKHDDQQTLFLMRAIYRSAQVMMLAHLLLAATAVFGLFHAPPPPNYHDAPLSFAGIVSGICVSITLTVHAALSRFWRHRITIGQYDGDGHSRDRRRTDHRSDPAS